jgi:hypothetical protein
LSAVPTVPQATAGAEPGRAAPAVDTSVVIEESVDARVGPRGSLEILSQAEIDKLLDTSQTGLYALFRNCALAVLNSGSESITPRRSSSATVISTCRSCVTPGASSSRSPTRRQQRSSTAT